MRKIAVFVFCLSLVACSSSLPVNHASSQAQVLNEQKVNTYIEAFNQRDLKTMMALVTDDIQWLSIEGETITVNSDSKHALSDILVSYFADCTTCRSKVDHMIASDRRVSVMEFTRWEANGETRSQGALSVYEFDGGKISRVYYFPSE